MIILITLFPVIVSSQDGLSEYRLGAGDVIRIQVFGQENLTIESKLSDAGTLSYPFLGELQTQGMTVGQLEILITNKLKDGYFIDPKVTVGLVSYRNVYVSGAVSRPGSYPFQPGLTIRKVISLAEGLSKSASSRKIFLISEYDPENIPRKVELDDLVQPGDTVNVGESLFNFNQNR